MVERSVWGGKAGGSSPPTETKFKVVAMRFLKECPVHGLTEHSIHKNGNAGNRVNCLKCCALRTKLREDANREKAYKLYGDSCKICGYNKCKNALEWHHLNPNEKENTPSKLMGASWEKVKKELDKCVLLCANCHREVHSGITMI